MTRLKFKVLCSMSVKLIKQDYTKTGKEVQLFKAESSPFTKSTILFIGVFHGDEPEGEPLILRLMEEIKSSPQIINEKTLLFIPTLNPDGKESSTRVNANGVDLNRNFPTCNWEKSEIKNNYYSGRFPASEIETRFVINILEEFSPSSILTIHNPYNVVNYDGPAKELAVEFAGINGYPVCENIGYPTPGSLGSYAGQEKNIPTITLELPEKTSIDKLWKDNKQAFLYFIQNA